MPPEQVPGMCTTPAPDTVPCRMPVRMAQCGSWQGAVERGAQCRQGPDRYVAPAPVACDAEVRQVVLPSPTLLLGSVAQDAVDLRRLVLMPLALAL